MIKYIYFLSLLLLGCATRKVYDCSTSVQAVKSVTSIDTNQLRGLLIAKWDYVYSISLDTCFRIPDLQAVDLSSFFQFYDFDTMDLEYKDSIFYEFGKGKLLFGLKCIHDDIPYGNESYVLASPLAFQGKKPFVPVYQYSGAVGKSYSYDIQLINDSVLIISNGVGYPLSGKLSFTLFHVYQKSGMAR